MGTTSRESLVGVSLDGIEEIRGASARGTEATVDHRHERYSKTRLLLTLQGQDSGMDGILPSR